MLTRRELAVVCLGIQASLGVTCTANAQASSAPELEPYFSVARITELAMSSDGAWLAFVVERRSLEDPSTFRQGFVQALAAPQSEPISVPDLADATNLAWIPDSPELAFLSSRAGHPEVYSMEVTGLTSKRRTQTPHGVRAFAFSPKAQRLIYSGTAVEGTHDRIGRRLKEGDSGILVDPDQVGLPEFLGGSVTSPPLGETSGATLWISDSHGTPVSLPVPGDVRNFFVSDDGSQVSVTYVQRDAPKLLIRDYLTSLAVCDLRSLRCNALFKARLTATGIGSSAYVGGEWAPDAHEFMVRRLTLTDVWALDSFPEWLTASSRSQRRQNQVFTRTSEAYDAAFHPRSDGTVFVENTVRGVRSLFVWSRQGARPAFPPGFTGSSTLIAFDEGQSMAAFVHESLERPPEIFLWRKVGPGGRLTQLTHVNRSISRPFATRAREVSWLGRDGVSVSGWLLEPSDSQFRPPWPLITFVHGGPTTVFPNRFAWYFEHWPYPIEAFPARGIAVFIPNYRGTASFGERFISPTALDNEPLHDIDSGIERLQGDGIADPTRMGIIGHSHGAWLGPMVLARSNRQFRAASFAEGAPNQITLFELYSGSLNREVHSRKFGGSLYENPARYIELSPNLQFSGVKSANLLEGGAQSAAVLMLSLAKASLRAGLPTEFVVYPRSEHSLTAMKLQKESAELNLDWFRYWLLCEEDASPTKAEQYDRWRKMRVEGDSCRRH